ncbi:tRNA (N(6)-L-threonylcarbamoyladenosine(37)-C(2))-methylthiotransferase MtaB [Orenia metallireducens]|jgi:threonylcarbamoyladenosine tRNA methylthiotransferase MtaB|uniref:Threonylcarbamoyladenosine tRNA methylthiotransferase MtaB n=1 Tax=Orenia metallireducens TaxID=1413210 RepID=A0A1C0A505_9FIRM|nr:tRNA (N(6)-L-threonylcarbamoyladenosine(37)-C(2))-methylthiotransferase MtaB [Orenia metallireducens]OCL25222.1 tRNA (N(6)-L-threonylcarbamoyladenosine(37)-C(2))-methylthiotransferase MtaB [Orenia metallireducens]
MKRVAFYTLGCKVNQYDTEAMMKQLEEAGYEIVDFESEADIYVINTCTVTQQGASKSRKITRRAKRRNPQALVAMVGCYPQVDADKVMEMAEVDLVVGTKGRSKIVEFVKQAMRAKGPVNFVQEMEEDDSFEEIAIEESKERTRASIKIQEGCDQFCSYCIIPYARGSLRSRSLEDVKAEVMRLAEGGFEEIVLTGIHLGQYGKDKEDLDLVKLIKRILTVEGIKRIRLSSIEGTEVSDELIDLIAESDKLCRHLHLPLQSGSDKILEAMNRPYNVQEFRDMVNKIKAKVPEIAITSDVIVGFPGESDEDFDDTYQVVKELEFSDLHIFKYSKRQGTPAADFENQVHSIIKKKRSEKLRELSEKLSSAYQQRFIGERIDVLLEEVRDSQTGMLTGLTDNYLRVLVDGSDDLLGKLVEVKLMEKEGELIGCLE